MSYIYTHTWKNELGRTRNADGRRENTQKNIRMEANREEN